MKQLKVVKSDVFRFMETCHESFDFIFAGPPYALTTIDDIPTMVFQQALLNEGGWFILEHTPRNNYQSYPNFLREKKYGTTVFSIFEKSGNDKTEGA